MAVVIAIVVPGKPQPKQRPRLGRGKVRTPQLTRRYEAKVAAYARKAYRGPPMTGVMGIRVDAYWERPARLTKGHPCRTGPDEAFPLALGGSHYGDASNVLKSCEDALNGVVWVDDSQVHECTCARWWAAVGEGSRVVINVWEVGNEPV